MTDQEAVALPKLTPEQLVLAYRELERRVNVTLTIIANVTRKARPEHRPAGFSPLVRAHRRTIHPYLPKGHVQIRFDHGSSLEFPIELLSLSDRDVATWARERIRASRHVAFAKKKRELVEDIAREERRIADARATLTMKQSQLANLGAAPRYEAPVRFPRKKTSRA